MEIDLRYERCDAPKFRDFQEASTGSVNSDWFATHEEYPSSCLAGDLPGKNEVLADVSNVLRPNVAAAAEAKPATKRKNIVTSWGQDNQDGRTAEEGAPVERTIKAQSKRSKAAKAEGRRESNREQRNRKLSVVQVTLKSKKAKPLVTKLPHYFVPARSTKQLTIPDDVDLHTSRRAKEHSKVQVVGNHDHDDGGSEPNTDGSQEDEPYKPLVLRVKEFDKTPGRFKRKPEPPPPSKPLMITEAKQPELLTSARVRPSMYKPREEVEAEEMAHMPVFRASTLNPLILSTSGQLGVPKVEKREVTEPQPFSFVTDDRAEARLRRQQQQQQQQQVAKPHAERQTVSDNEGRDKPGKEARARARKSEACHATETVQSRAPKLHTQLRAREPTFQVQHHEFKARPVPKFLSLHSSIELPKEAPPAPTQLQPFRLATEERGAKYRAELVNKVAEEERAARRARVPRAHGLPLSTDMPMVPPKPEPRGLTVPEPFTLLSEVRHKEHEEQLRKALEEEEAAKRAEAAFKARPMWKGIPFQPHAVDLPITVPEPVALHTSARVAVREEFNKKIEERWREAEAAAKREEEEKRLREEEERRQLRKAAVFHALPMPDLSAPPAVKPPPLKPVTKAMSPALATRKRRRTRRQQQKQQQGDDSDE